MNPLDLSKVLASHAEADAARFVWWFSKADGVQKGNFVPEYLRGLREGWSLDKWRVAIDKAMDKAENAALNQQLRASIEAGRSKDVLAVNIETHAVRGAV